MTFQIYWLCGVLKAVKGLADSFNLIWKNPDLQSNFENHFLLSVLLMSISLLGRKYPSKMVTSLSRL